MARIPLNLDASLQTGRPSPVLDPGPTGSIATIGGARSQAAQTIAAAITQTLQQHAQRNMDSERRADQVAAQAKQTQIFRRMETQLAETSDYSKLPAILRDHEREYETFLTGKTDGVPNVRYHDVRTQLQDAWSREKEIQGLRVDKRRIALSQRDTDAKTRYAIEQGIVGNDHPTIREAVAARRAAGLLTPEQAKIELSSALSAAESEDIRHALEIAAAAPLDADDDPARAEIEERLAATEHMDEKQKRATAAGIAHTFATRQAKAKEIEMRVERETQAARKQAIDDIWWSNLDKHGHTALSIDHVEAIQGLTDKERRQMQAMVLRHQKPEKPADTTEEQFDATLSLHRAIDDYRPEHDPDESEALRLTFDIDRRTSGAVRANLLERLKAKATDPDPASPIKQTLNELYRGVNDIFDDRQLYAGKTGIRGFRADHTDPQARASHLAAIKQELEAAAARGASSSDLRALYREIVSPLEIKSAAQQYRDRYLEQATPQQIRDRYTSTPRNDAKFRIYTRPVVIDGREYAPGVYRVEDGKLIPHTGNK